MDLPQHFQSFTLQSDASQEEDMIPKPNLEGTVMTRPPLGGCEININPGSAYAPSRAPSLCRPVATRISIPSSTLPSVAGIHQHPV